GLVRSASSAVRPASVLGGGRGIGDLSSRATRPAESCASLCGRRSPRAVWATQGVKEGKLSELDAQSSGVALALPVGAQSAQTLDGHGVEGERLGTLHQAVEQLVVPGRGEPELVADRLFLRTLELPPLAFEGENTLFAFGEDRLTVLGRT